MLFNTNADMSPTGATNSVEAAPSGHIDVHTDIPALQLFLQAGVEASFERFTNTVVASDDTITGGVLLQYQSMDGHGTTIDGQEYQPFFKYGPQWDYAPFLATRTSAVHDFTIGADKAFLFDAGFRRIARPAAGAPPVDPESDPAAYAIWTAQFELTGTRRVAETSSSSYKLHLSPRLVYAWTNTRERTKNGSSQWSATLGLDVDRQVFDGTGQENWTLTPVLNKLPSHWFKNELGRSSYAAHGAPQISLQAAYNWLSSSAPGTSAGEWTFGPMVQAGWKF